MSNHLILRFILIVKHHTNLCLDVNRNLGLGSLWQAGGSQSAHKPEAQGKDYCPVKPYLMGWVRV